MLSYGAALKLAREVANNPATGYGPATLNPIRRPQSVSASRKTFWPTGNPQRRLGVLGYDDLLSRLAAALDTDDSPAQVRMYRRWPIVMVDEFQDTDRVQWQVIDRAFSGRSTVILIGDPKQAIYAFRGGDIVRIWRRPRRPATSRPWPPTGAVMRRCSTGCRWCCVAPTR